MKGGLFHTLQVKHKIGYNTLSKHIGKTFHTMKSFKNMPKHYIKGILSNRDLDEKNPESVYKIDEIDKVIEGMPKDTLIKEDMAYHKGKLMYRDSMKGKKGYIYHEERKIHPKL